VKTILLVEDDKSIRDPLAEYLTRQGFKVLTAGFLADAKKLLEGPVDCVVMDWNLPDGEGVDLARTMKDKPGSPPVLMLTARADVIDKVVGLEMAANDYMTKPYDPRELLARVKNLMRVPAGSGAGGARGSVQHLGVTLDLTSHEASYQGKNVPLSKMEFDLLKLFCENPGKVFSRDELLNLVWGYERYPSTRTVDTHVLQLRTKLSEDLIETVRGVGYRCKK